MTTTQASVPVDHPTEALRIPFGPIAERSG